MGQVQVPHTRGMAARNKSNKHEPHGWIWKGAKTLLSPLECPNWTGEGLYRLGRWQQRNKIQLRNHGAPTNVPWIRKIDLYCGDSYFNCGGCNRK